MNMFSIFDPSNMFMFNLNWLSIYTPILYTPMLYWMLSNRINKMWNLLFMFIHNEMLNILIKKIYSMMMIPLFFMIIMFNLNGLIPNIFTPSTHLSINLSISLPMWLEIMILSWFFNTNKILIHMTPHSTPPPLMPIMVIIESISNLIRPWTLSIRLTANMIAGHLLITLISNNGNKLLFVFMLILIITQSILMILELSVAMIQAYVFTILTSLYSQEM